VIQLNQVCECQCGKTELLIKGKPITRIACHCQICQEFNQADFADITLFLSKDVMLSHDNTVDFKAYQSPPAVQRGKCVYCNNPAIERFDMPLCPSITMIPSNLIPPGSSLPSLSAHIFYHRKITDIHDSLPKISGFLKSQLFVGKQIVTGIIKNKLSLSR
tara:strand:+ start:8601 stop:9083 length:483 start_codon:yes stop_codon:yes gene_type:complete